jgi:hypothetical protein
MDGWMVSCLGDAFIFCLGDAFIFSDRVSVRRAEVSFGIGVARC